MNTKEINPQGKGTLSIYFAVTITLTVLTAWIIIAFQSRYLLRNMSFWARLGWPWFMFEKWWSGKRSREARARQVMDRAIQDDYDDEMEGLKPNDNRV
jgi:hypothetical protein